MGFNKKYNTDNVFSRAVIVGLINLLNNKIKFINQLSDDKIDIIEVPWFFTHSADERFMQDYFTFWGDCVHPKFSDGNFDVIPRGVVTLTEESINSSALTHRFIRGKRVKEINGELHTFNAYINSIPLTMSFECKLIADSYINALKIQQAIRETFFKIQVFHTSYNGFRIPCQVGFPESVGLEKTFEFSYADDNKIILNFNLEVETYHPVIDETSERLDTNRISAFNAEVSSFPGNETFANKKSIKIKKPDPNDPGKFYFTDSMLIEWDHTGNILRVDLFYSLDNGTNWEVIDKFITNKNSYIWKIPQFSEVYPYVLLSQDSKTPAVLRPVVDGTGSISDIIIYSGGAGYDNTLKAEIEQKNFTGTPAIVEPIIQNGSIVEFKIHDGGAGYVPTQIFNVGIRICDSNDNRVFDEIFNIEVL